MTGSFQDLSYHLSVILPFHTIVRETNRAVKETVNKLIQLCRYKDIFIVSYSSCKLCCMLLYHHHISVMDLGHLLAHSSLTCLEVSSKVCLGSFCQSGSSVSLPWVIYYEAFCLHVVSSFSCILVICPKLELFLTALQFVYLFCSLFNCILPFFSSTSSLLLIFCERSLL
jgi:hypothetical protein